MEHSLKSRVIHSTMAACNSLVRKHDMLSHRKRVVIEFETEDNGSKVRESPCDSTKITNHFSGIDQSQADLYYGIPCHYI